VLTVIDGDEIAMGYFTEKVEWDSSIKNRREKTNSILPMSRVY
jgi:hypothetical protein